MKHASRRLALVLVLAVAATSRKAISQSASQSATGDTAGLSAITGIVRDAASGAPVPQARVTLRGTSLGVSTDIDGRFALRPIAAGVHTIDVHRIGYEPLVRADIAAGPGERVALTLLLQPAAFRLAEVTVTPGSFSFLGSGAASSQTRTRADIETAPFGEDLFRAMNRLPGLSSGDYGANFSIRGGRADETLILLDGLEIYEPYHMKDFAEGAVSIIDVETIDGVELLAGGFPAHYGDKRSGVMSITSRTPKDSATHVTAGASLTNLHALGEGSFNDRKGSWLLSGRNGFADLMLGFINKKETTTPKYQDVFATVRYRIHPNHTLALSALHARDSYRFGINATTGFNDTITTRETANNGYGNSYLWATLHSLLGEHLSVRTLASTGLITASRQGDETATLRGLEFYGVRGHRDFNFIGLKQDYSFQRFTRSILDWGFDVRSMRANFDWTNRVNQNPDKPVPDTTGFYPHVTRRAKSASGSTLGAYVSERLQLFDPLTLETGVRYDGATYTHDRDWSPRVHALIRLSDRSSLRAGWGMYRQRQGIADENAFDKLNRYFPSELSRQWTVGLEHRYAGGGSLRVEGYYKLGSRLRPILRNWKAGMNVFPESAEDRILVYPDKSTSKGVELYQDHSLGPRLDFRASYALSFVDEHVTRIDQVNDPLKPAFRSTHPGPQDQRHALNADVIWRPFTNWTVNTGLTYHSGWPFTYEIGTPVTKRNGTRDILIKPDSLYGRRLPAYQRIDVRVTRRLISPNGEWRFFAEVVNLTNHQNVLGYDVYVTRDAGGTPQLQRDPETWFSILPSLGVSWSRTF